MKQFKIVPLDLDYVRRIREANKDDYGHELIEQVATGRGPCRVSLKPFTVGKDKRLLFSHSPFTIDNAYNQTGPILIFKDEVEPYSDVHRFPPEIKEDKRHFKLALLGYSKEQMMVYTKLVGDLDVDTLISEIFEKHPEVDYLHARNADAGCYICKIERV